VKARLLFHYDWGIGWQCSWVSGSTVYCLCCSWPASWISASSSDASKSMPPLLLSL
jgi:hypothetical protein